MALFETPGPSRRDGPEVFSDGQKAFESPHRKVARYTVSRTRLSRGGSRPLSLFFELSNILKRPGKERQPLRVAPSFINRNESPHPTQQAAGLDRQS
jgi:hypothetical protein